MIVAYLVNQYPHVSHTFIRREIMALEHRGLEVRRFSIRPAPKDLVDPADAAEIRKTHVLLSDGLGRLAGSCLAILLTHPVLWFRTLATAIRLGQRSDRGLFRHFAYFLEACRLRRLVADVQHLHAHFGTNSATVAMLCWLLGGPRYSFTVHGPEEFDKPEALSLGEKIQRCAFVVAISSYGRSQLSRWSRFADWPKIQVVHCGLDADFLNAESTPVPDTRQLVCVGRLSEQKGQMLLLEAIERLTSSGVNVQLVLAGDGPLRSVIEREIRLRGLDNVVRITGWVTGDQVRQLIHKSRGLVLPSFAEGLPVVLMEALALGRPVVSTYIAGIPELVRPEVNGWLVPAGNVNELVSAIRELILTSPPRLTEMGLQGVKAVRDCHDIHVEAEKLCELFGAAKG